MKVLLRSDSWCGRVAYLHFLFTSKHQRAILFRKRLKIDALTAGKGRGSTELRPTSLYHKYPSLFTALQVYHTRIGKNFLTDRKSRKVVNFFFVGMKKRIRNSREVQREIDNEVLLDTTTTGDDVVVGVTDETTIKEMFEALSDADLAVAAAGFEATEEEEEESSDDDDDDETEIESTDDDDDDDDDEEEEEEEEEEEDPPPAPDNVGEEINNKKKKGPWNQREKDQFQAGLVKHGNSPIKIARVIPTRTYEQVRSHYTWYFQQQRTLARRIAPTTTATTTTATTPTRSTTTDSDYFQWNDEEHEEFVKLLEVHGNQWTHIAAHMNNRRSSTGRNKKHSTVTKTQVATHAHSVYFHKLKKEDATHGTDLYREMKTRIAATGKAARRRRTAAATAATTTGTTTVSKDDKEDEDEDASSLHRAADIDAADGGTNTAAVVTRAAVGSAGNAVGGAATATAATVKSKRNNYNNNTHIHGTKILKKFRGKPFRGWIVRHSSSSPLTYQVEYEDGDKEELTHHEVTTLLSSYEATIPELQAQKRRREGYPPYTKILREPYRGWVTQYQDPYYAVEYENGDIEDLRPEQVTKYLCEYQENIADIQQSNSSGPGGGQGRGKSKQVLQREQRLSNKRKRERAQHSFHDNDNDKLQQQQPPPRLAQQQQKKKPKKTITNRKYTTTNNVVKHSNNDEIMRPASLSPSALMAPSASPAESDESSESESVVRSVSSETQQLPSTTTVAVGTVASKVLVHEKHATTTRTVTAAASASLLSSSPVVAAVLATDSLQRTMEGSSTPDTTTRTASAVRRAAAPVTSISYPLVQPSPASSPPIAPASASANNTIQIKHDSFRFHGQDKIRFNTLFTVELEYIHNRKNGEMNQVNFTGIAAMMKCDIQKVMSHFYKSGREHEIKKGYI